MCLHSLCRCIQRCIGGAVIGLARRAEQCGYGREEDLVGRRLQPQATCELAQCRCLWGQGCTNADKALVV